MKKIEDIPNYNYLMEISKGDEKFIIEIIQLFILKMPLNIDEITNSLTDKKWEEVGFYLHKLKSPLKILAIDDVVLKVEKLEKMPLSDSTLDAFLEDFNVIQSELEAYIESFKNIELTKDKSFG